MAVGAQLEHAEFQCTEGIDFRRVAHPQNTSKHATNSNEPQLAQVLHRLLFHVGKLLVVEYFF